MVYPQNVLFMEGGAMLAIIVLLAVTEGVTPAQHQQAATALYEVLVSYNAHGLFSGAPKEEGVTPTAEHSDGSLTIGTAFAVSEDGWLITAGHVVDSEMKIRDLCEHLSTGWPGLVMLRHATFTVLIKDIAGNTYGIVATVEPSTTGDNLCVPGTLYGVSYNTTTRARIVARDDIADLALIQLDAVSISYLQLAPKAPARWADLFVVGYTDPGVRTTVSGAVAIRCELTEGDCASVTGFNALCPNVAVMRTTAAVQDGMSGSPQVIGGVAVGITTMRALGSPIGFAIPSPYALKWYQHVRWPAKYMRPTTVCVPTPEP